jgi:hypothetical protein
MEPTMKIEAIIKTLKAQDYNYYGKTPKGWTPSSGRFFRIYFGRDFVTVENNVAHNGTKKARALSIGHSAVEKIQEIIDQNQK